MCPRKANELTCISLSPTGHVVAILVHLVTTIQEDTPQVDMAVVVVAEEEEDMAGSKITRLDQLPVDASCSTGKNITRRR